jgi:Fic family protein
MDKIAIELSTLGFLKDLDKLKNEIESFKPFPKEVEGRIMQKFRLEWNYHSNAIEGNSLTYGETVSFLMYGFTAKGKPLKDHLEIRGHNKAIDFLLNLIKDPRPISESDIRALHKMILVEPYESDAITPDGQPTKKIIEIGKYKTQPNHVKTQTGQIHYYATPEDTPALMNELMNFYKQALNEKGIHSLVLSALFHHRFVAIHPFADGNGRTARWLSNLILMQAGWPPIVIRQEDRYSYYEILNQANAGEYIPMIQFWSEQLKRSLEIYLKAAKGESIDEPSDIDKEIALFKAGFDKENKISLKNDNETLLRVMNKSFIPLEKAITTKFQSIEDLFLDKKYYLSCNIFNEDTNFEFYTYIDVEAQLLTNHFSDDKINCIQYFYILKGFKKSIPTFDIGSNIQMEFSEYTYTILAGSNIKIDKHYHQDISKEEMNDIVNSFMKDIMKHITQKSSQN